MNGEAITELYVLRRQQRIMRRAAEKETMKIAIVRPSKGQGIHPLHLHGRETANVEKAAILKNYHICVYNIIQYYLYMYINPSFTIAKWSFTSLVYHNTRNFVHQSSLFQCMNKTTSIKKRKVPFQSTDWFVSLQMGKGLGNTNMNGAFSTHYYY